MKDFSGYEYTNRYFSIGIVLFRDNVKTGTILTARTPKDKLCPEYAAVSLIRALEAAGVPRSFVENYSGQAKKPAGITCLSRIVNMNFWACLFLFAVCLIAVVLFALLSLGSLLLTIAFAALTVILVGAAVWAVWYMRGYSSKTTLETSSFTIDTPFGSRTEIRFVDIARATVCNNPYTYHTVLELKDRKKKVKLRKGSAGYSELGSLLILNRVPIVYQPDGLL